MDTNLVPVDLRRTEVQQLRTTNPVKLLRVMRPQPVLKDLHPDCWLSHCAPAPYHPGGRLFGRESWNARYLDCKFWHQYQSGDRKNTVLKQNGDWGVFYRADDPDDNGRFDHFFGDVVQVPCWLPSITMPRWASRLTLEVVSIGIEQDHQRSWCWAITVQEVSK